MYNIISTGQDTLNNTSSTLTLGFGPNQTAPPMYLIQALTAGGTVTLPKINQVPPSPPATPGTTPGVSDGYTLVIKSTTNFVTTITPASGDTCDVSLLTQPSDAVWLEADSANSKWRSIVPVGAATQIATLAASAGTLAATTRYLIISTAGTLTIPAPAGLVTGQPYTVINESNNSETLTPVSGTIDTTASFTLTTLKSFTLFSDGTNFHAINTQ